MIVTETVVIVTETAVIVTATAERVSQTAEVKGKKEAGDRRQEAEPSAFPASAKDTESHSTPFGALCLLRVAQARLWDTRAAGVGCVPGMAGLLLENRKACRGWQACSFLTL